MSKLLDPISILYVLIDLGVNIKSIKFLLIIDDSEGVLWQFVLIVIGLIKLRSLLQDASGTE